jgi:hypothetical protein
MVGGVSTLSEEGNELGLDALSSQDLPDEGNVFGCVYAFLDLSVCKIAY